MNDVSYIVLGIIIVGLLFLLLRYFNPLRGDERQRHAFHEGIDTYERGGSLKDTWKAIRDSQKKSRL